MKLSVMRSKSKGEEEEEDSPHVWVTVRYNAATAPPSKPPLLFAFAFFLSETENWKGSYRDLRKWGNKNGDSILGKIKLWRWAIMEEISLRGCFGGKNKKYGVHVHNTWGFTAEGTTPNLGLGLMWYKIVMARN